MSSSLNVDDFIAGIMSSLKLSNVDTITTEDFHKRVVQAFQLLEQVSLRRNIELRFHCQLMLSRPWSPVLHYALAKAEESKIIARDGQQFNINLSPAECSEFINNSPLTPSEWKLISQNFRREAALQNSRAFFL